MSLGAFVPNSSLVHDRANLKDWIVGRLPAHRSLIEGDLSCEMRHGSLMTEPWVAAEVCPGGVRYNVSLALSELEDERRIVLSDLGFEAAA